MNRLLPALLLIVTTACAHRSGELRPRVDHHQHLFSPALVRVLNRALPRADVPADVAALLDERAARWNDPVRLAELFTEASLVLSDLPPGWLHGREAGANYLGRRFARPFTVTPVRYEADGDTARVAAYYTRGETHFGYVFFDLERDAGGWRIAVENAAFPGPSRESVLTGDDLVTMLDEAGIERALLLSVAYLFDSPLPDVNTHDDAALRAENDWTAQEAAKHPARLVAFCSVNPLSDTALAELDHCAANGAFRGLKLHFGASMVDLSNRDHVERVRRVFAVANAHRLPVLVHARTEPFGREEVQTLLDGVLPAAPEIAVIVAHLWGGAGYAPEALSAFAEAMESGRPSARNLWFEMSQMALALGGQPDQLREAAALMRRIGIERILYGSDAPGPDGLPPLESWLGFRRAVPLTEEEFRTIAENVAPFLR